MRINNKVASHFMNEMDFAIRFFYCRLGFLKKLMFWHLYSSDFEKRDRSFEEMKMVFERHNVRISDKTILELGPGNSRIIGYNFLNHAAKEVILLDKYPRIQDSKKQRKFQDDELKFIARKYNYGEPDVSENSINPDNIRFLSGDLCELDLADVDIIFSNSVFEHVRNVDEVIGCMSKILVKGGYMYHNIDLRDHFNFNSPFLFYKYDQDAWNRYLTKEGTSFTNRLRYNDYMDLFEKHSFEVVSKDITRQELGSVKLSSQFADRNKEDLEVCTLCVLLRKK
jgi:SAM-dependent methyltransferase